MANRDVNLILRAKDEASKAVSALSDSLKVLQESQRLVSTGAEKSESSLSKFGAALAGLQKQVGTGGVGQKLANDMRLAEVAITKLNSSIASNQEAQTRLALDADRTARAVDGLSEREAELTREIDRQKQSLTGLAAARRAASKAATSSARGSESGQAAPDAAAGLSSARGAETAQIESLKNLRTELANVRQARRGAESDAFKQAQASDAAGRAAERESVALKQAETAFEALGTETKRAEAELGKFAQTADRGIRQTLISQTRALIQTRDAYQSNTRAVGDAARALNQARAEYAAVSGTLGQFTGQAAAAAERVQALEQAFNEARARAGAAKNEFLANRNSLASLKGIAAETATDLDTLASRQARFAAAQTSAAGANNAARIQSQALAQATQQTGQALTTAEPRARRLTGAAAALARTLGVTVNETESLDDALRRFYGGSRQALSLLQRLRGQVLGLAASYVGFFAAQSALGSVVSTIQTLEAAQSRLVVVNEGNTQKIAADLDFVRRNADRLGIEYGTLADQYTKFAAATKNTPIEDDTAGIFLAVAEAGRVNKLSLDQLNRTLTALGQIASKGTVQMEELKGQLGDQLPGALQIMADGLGITVAELTKLTENGELSSDSLANFGRELNNRFGKALPAALNSTTTAMGRFQNATFQARAEFAQAGFDEALKNLLVTAVEVLQSPEFKSSLQSLAQVTGAVFSLIEGALKNFQLIVTGVVAVLSIRFVPVVIFAVRQLIIFAAALAGQVLPAAGRAATAVALMSVRMRQVGPAAAVASVGVRGLSTNLKLLLASTGIGLAFVAVTTAMAFLGTRASDTSKALARQEQITNALANAYQRGATSATDLAAAVGTIPAAALQNDISNLRQEAANTFDEAAGKARRFGAAINGALLEFGPLRQELSELTARFVAGGISQQQYAASLQEISDRYDDTTRQGRFLKDVVGEVSSQIGVQAEAARRLRVAQIDLAIQTGKVTEALLEERQALLAANSAAIGIAGGFVEGQRQAQGFSAALTEIQQGVPEIKKELEKAAALDDLKEILKAEGLPETLDEINLRLAAFRLQLSQTQGSGIFIEDTKGELQAQIDNLEKLADAVAKRRKAIEDDGKPKKTGSGRSKKDEAAEAINGLRDDLRADEEALAIAKLEANNQNLEAILQNRRNTVNKIREELTKTASASQLKEFDALSDQFVQFGALEAQQSDLESFLDSIRSIKEAADEASAELVELTVGETDYADRLEQLRVSQQAFATEVLKGLEGVEITAEQRQQVDLLLQSYRDATKAVFDFNEAERASVDALAAAEKAQDRVNAMLQQRQQLEQLLELRRTNGDSGAIQETESQIRALDSSILSTINDARALWQALSGSEDQDVAALAKQRLLDLQVTTEGLKESYSGFKVTLKDIGDTIAANLTDAVSQFAEAVANGEPIFESLGRAIQSFVSETLIQIGRAITQALIYQAVTRALGIPTGGTPGIAGPLPFLAGIFHSGGTAGSANRTRSVNPAVFAGAPRFHDGAAGIGSNEVPAILERGEDVLADDNPFHSKNLNDTVDRLSSGGGSPVNAKIVNVFDSAQVLQTALADTAGQKVMLNFVRQNSREFNANLNN